jgi:hypothetical protein
MSVSVSMAIKDGSLKGSLVACAFVCIGVRGSLNFSVSSYTFPLNLLLVCSQGEVHI